MGQRQALLYVSHIAHGHRRVTSVVTNVAMLAWRSNDAYGARADRRCACFAASFEPVWNGAGRRNVCGRRGTGLPCPTSGMPSQCGNDIDLVKPRQAGEDWRATLVVRVEQKLIMALRVMPVMPDNIRMNTTW